MQDETMIEIVKLLSSFTLLGLIIIGFFWIISPRDFTWKLELDNNTVEALRIVNSTLRIDCSEFEELELYDFGYDTLDAEVYNCTCTIDKLKCTLGSFQSSVPLRIEVE